MNTGTIFIFILGALGITGLVIWFRELPDHRYDDVPEKREREDTSRPRVERPRKQEQETASPLSAGPAQPFPDGDSQFKGRSVFAGARKQSPQEKLSKFNPGPVSQDFAVAFDAVYEWMWERVDFTTKARNTQAPGQKEDVRRAAYLWTIMLAYCQYDEGIMNASFVRLWTPPMLSGPKDLLRTLREGWEKRDDSPDRTTALAVLNDIAIDHRPWGEAMINMAGFAGMITGAVIDPLKNK